MTVVKRKGGWKIKSHKTRKVYPKLYKTKKAAQRRIKQMKYYGSK